MRIRAGFWMAILSTRENDVVGRVDMAIGALRAVVRQTEPSVIERSAQPIVRVVASQAGLRIIQRHVIRNARASQIGSALVVRFVAAVAVGRDGSEIIVYVAACARNGKVRAN